METLYYCTTNNCSRTIQVHCENDAVCRSCSKPCEEVTLEDKQITFWQKHISIFGLRTLLPLIRHTEIGIELFPSDVILLTTNEACNFKMSKPEAIKLCSEINEFRLTTFSEL